MPETAIGLSPEVHAFLAQPHVASLASVDPDGAPRQVAIWFRLEPDGRILVNGRTPRRWCENLRRDPRVGISIIDGRDPYRWVGLTAEVDEVVDDVDRARDDIVELAHRYRPGGPTPAAVALFRSQQRVTFRLRVTGVHDHLED